MRRPAYSAGMSADPHDDQAPVDDLGDDELDEVAGGALLGGDANGYPSNGGNGGNGGRGGVG